MDYREFKFTCSEDFREILIAELSEIGFDAFLETDEGFECYSPLDSFDREAFDEILNRYQGHVSISFSENLTKKVNWNEEWEKNYDPIAVGDLVFVRASFHEPRPGFKYQIVINPKMSFGTGHHATTFQILQLQGKIDHQGKRVLDVGSGTGILAIMAHLLGASSVEAFDIDDWCVDNGNENFQLNEVPATMGLGSIRDVNPKGPFDIILANINKNVLLDEMEIYSRLLAPHGYLLLSGFYTHDIADIQSACEKLGLELVNQSEKDNWAALVFTKS